MSHTEQRCQDCYATFFEGGTRKSKTFSVFIFLYFHQELFDFYSQRWANLYIAFLQRDHAILD